MLHRWNIAFGAGLLCAMVTAMGLGGCASAQKAESRGVSDDGAFVAGKVDGVTIDGDGSEWGERGLAVKMMTMTGGDLPEAKDFDAQFRLGWDERGLLVWATVRDDRHWEDSGETIWQADAMELFVADRRGGAQRVQALIAPGLDARKSGMEVRISDQRSDAGLRKRAVEVKAARVANEEGYTAEVLVPWEALGVKAEDGREVGVQLYFNDKDEEGGKRKQMVWYPGSNTYADGEQMNVVRLEEGSGEAVTAAAKGMYEFAHRAMVDVACERGWVGQELVLMNGSEKIAKGKVEEKNGRGSVMLRAVVSDARAGLRDVTVRTADGRLVTKVKMPGWEEEKAGMVLESELWCEPGYVFGGEGLPRFEFAHPVMMENVIGEYAVDVKYYDAEHRLVSKAGKVGRYGAVVTITAEDGRKLVRYRTLYRMAKQANAWDMRMTGKVDLPREYGIDAEVMEAANAQVMDHMKMSFAIQAERAHWNAIMLAGMSEMKAEEKIGAYNNSWARDRQWWVEQKRMMNGNGERFAEKLDRPQKLNNADATVIHEGTMAEAGMTADAPTKIDAVLTEWSKDTDEAFIACVVRNGVVVLHKAYGERDGKPMTTETKSWMASLSKLISGTCLMMAVDQGEMDLDAPVSVHSPALKEAKFDHMPTLRNLYTHTAGMTSHRGEDDHELEYLAAELAPTLKVADRFEYDGMGLELGMKLLEQVSGESYPQYVRKHLLEPLGCENTDALNASWNTQSTAMDMAKIGQMLLNGGAYGPYMFLSSHSRDAALPVAISELIGKPSDVKYGIGTQWFNEPGLSDRCYGHGSAASATLRIDLKNKLVISMTRNSAGKNFGKYHPLFIKTVTDCMVE